MKVTPQDLELFAARIRPYFEPQLRDFAYALALDISRCVGPKVKQLRPDTRMTEIFQWLEEQEPFPRSLDQVELVMALEVEMGLEVPDEMAKDWDRLTFRSLVLERARRRRAA
jgi:hypothetical protein